MTNAAVLDPGDDLYSPGISWGAVIGGAFVAAALSLILVALGAGFGLEVISPWSNTGTTAKAVEAAGIVWLIFIEVVASAFGGYLAGRLRTRWRLVHTDEVHFRDTANGFLVWAVGVVITASFLATAAVSLAGGARATDTAEGGRRVMDRVGYFSDQLFRSDRPGAVDANVRAEAARIFGHALLGTEATAGDIAYLSRLVSAGTGLNQADAERRVTDTLNEARQAEDTLRRNTARLLLWTFIALLAGAFCASYAATIGGRQRD